MVKIGLLGFVLLVVFCFANSVRSASNEHLRDGIDRLGDMDITMYCGNVAEYHDDGMWAASMGIADEILGRTAEEPDVYTLDKLPREGIHHHAWNGMNSRERAWYSIHFHQGWKDGSKFISENPEALVEHPQDMSGLIPIQIRMEMKEARYRLCLHEGRPREA